MICSYFKVFFIKNFIKKYKNNQLDYIRQKKRVNLTISMASLLVNQSLDPMFDQTGSKSNRQVFKTIN